MATNTKKPPTKSEIYAKIVEDTGLTRKDIAAVFDSLNGQIKKNLGGRGAPGLFTVPGLLKMRVVKKPARKARKGVPNPFKPGELMDVAAKTNFLSLSCNRAGMSILSRNIMKTIWQSTTSTSTRRQVEQTRQCRPYPSRRRRLDTTRSSRPTHTWGRLCTVTAWDQVGRKCGLPEKRLHSTLHSFHLPYRRSTSRV